MGQEIQVPDWAKNAPAPAFAGLNAQDDSLALGIGQSYAVIGYKGKQWSLRHRGERHNFIRPDDGTPSSYLDVIILGQAKQKSKSYYKKYDQNTSDGDRPICASLDGIVPDADVADKQCDTCALCPRNEWKTDPQTGRKGRECTDYKRLAVLILPTQTKSLLGSPLMEAAFLRVPPDSLNSLANMGDTMVGQGFHYSSYITRITFDPNKSHPCMVFRPLQGLTDKEAPVILDMRRDAAVGRITGGDIVMDPPKGTTALPPQAAVSGIVIENPPQPSTVAPSAAAPTTGTPEPGPTPEKPSTPLASAPPATPDVAVVASVAMPALAGLVDTGFGGVTNAAEQRASPPQGDTGQPEASDADLDARIAAMINKK